jgi:excinuclease ABC subunit A
LNSTVATVTEIAHYLRLLYAKIGELFCPKCGAHVAPTSAEKVYRHIAEGKARGPVTLYAPAVRARKGTYLDVFTAAARGGLRAARVDGAIVPIDPPPKLTKTKEHSIDLIVFYGEPSSLDRATVDLALAWGDGAVRVAHGPPKAKSDDSESVLSTSRACPDSCVFVAPLTRSFSPKTCRPRSSEPETFPFRVITPSSREHRMRSSSDASRSSNASASGTSRSIATHRPCPAERCSACA